jgi:hypothetical protein
LTKKAPYKGLSADSEEKHEPVSDIDTAVVVSLKVLDPKRPIREADIKAVLYWRLNPSGLDAASPQFRSFIWFTRLALRSKA